MKIEVPNFGYVGREGEVYLPTRTIRVAIPEGTGEVRLQSIKGSPEPVSGVVLREPADESRRRGTRAPGLDPAAAAGRRSGAAAKDPEEFRPPGEPVRLGDVGYLRDQRFVEVIYTPVISPRGGGEALFFGEIDLDIVVDGLVEGAVADEAAPPDPTFESQYQDAFVNYDEGRFMRSRGPQPRAAASRRAGVAGGESLASAAYSTSGAGILANNPAYKITVSKDGIYRLTQTYLLDPNRAAGLAGADPRGFRLMNRGTEVPIFVQGEADGSFDAGDYIEFYGQKIDGPENTLNYNLGLLPSIYQYDDYTDRNVYWLDVEPVLPRARIPTRSAPPNAGYAVAADFDETLHFEVDNLYQASGGEDPFLMVPRLNSNNGSVAADANTCLYNNPGIQALAALDPNYNYLGPGVTDPNSIHYCPVCRMALPGINASAGTPATIRARMRGTTSEPGVVPDHLSVLEASGVASRSTAACWSGLNFAVQTLNVTHAQLTNPLDIRIDQPGLAATVSSEQLLVDWTEVSYRRLFQAVSDGLKFTVPDQNSRLSISGLSTNASANVEVFEITSSLAPVDALGGGAIASPVRVSGGTFTGSSGNFTLTFTNDDDPNSATSRTYAVAGPGTGGLLLPDSVVLDVPSTLLEPTNEADVIVIGDPSVVDTSPSSAFSIYWSHRAAVDGLVVKTVMVQDVFDEFGYGIPHPEALRNFLSYAYDNWKGPVLDPNRPHPAYVTIVGDTTADPKNNLVRSDWINVVPTFIMYQQSSVLGFYSSDNYIAAFRGADQLPDVHLGRLPVRTLADSTNVFTKLYNYDTASPAGAWRGRLTLIADEGKAPGESADFMRISDEVSSGFWQPQPPFSAVKIYYDTATYSFGTNATKMFNDVVAAHNNGNIVFQYTGHGSFSIFGVDGWFFSSDVASLAANGMYSFQINENCLSGGFHALAGDALCEAFLKAPGKGSVAYFAPAGLSFSFIGESINNQIYGDMFGPRRTRRFGPLITDVRLMLGNLGSIIDLQSYTMIGDPTQEVLIPNPNPPQSLQAVSGNAVVHLSWTPGPDPNTRTILYRATSPAGPYSLITPSPLTTTAYDDPNVSNATSYYYEAASLDASNFEGRRSNFNSDCVTSNLPASGPDCVWARPVNPTPPQTPTGTNVYNDGAGTKLRVVWNLNPENDLQSYVVRYGTQQGGPYPNTAYGSPTDTGVTLSGLQTNVVHYILVSARNTSLLESAAAPELAGKPMVFEGTNPPEMIADLRIERTAGDPNSLTLTWTAPTEDIYGGPTKIASFSIYRDTFPTFIPSPANRITTITNPAVTSYVDPGAAVAPANYYYLVSAVDPRGYGSGLSHDLPAGIADLRVDITGSTMHFTWTPITKDVRGRPTTVQKYVLYASDTPIPRIRTDSLAPLVDNVQGASLDVLAVAQHRYYTVIVVDMRGQKSPF